MVTTISHQDVLKLFRSNKCFLLSKYTNSRQKLNYFCKCGSLNSQTFYQFKNTKGCKNCNKKKSLENKDVEIYKKVSNVFGRLMLRTLAPEFTVFMIESTLGYTKEDLYLHITSFDKFDFKQSWVIDHKIPIKAFTDHGIVGLTYSHIINSLENLQPLGERENNEKGSYYDLDEFYGYLKKHNVEPATYPNYVSNQKINDYFGL